MVSDINKIDSYNFSIPKRSNFLLLESLKKPKQPKKKNSKWKL